MPTPTRHRRTKQNQSIIRQNHLTTHTPIIITNMKHFSIPHLLILTSITAQAYIQSSNELTERDIKFGLEGLTTWRSEYMYRGFKLADKSMEFQLAGQVALSNSETIDLGLYFDTATGDGNFTETGAFIDFSKNIGDLTYTAKFTLRDYANSTFKSGADIGGSISLKHNKNIDFTALLTYDTGASGAYSELKTSYYKELSIDSFILFNAGISATADYYDRSGIHHLFAKLEYTYNISDNVSFTPFIGTSIGIHSKAPHSIYSGINFAVSF